MSIRLGDDTIKSTRIIQYGVHFENVELGVCEIDAGNLRVLFDLPDEKPGSYRA